MNSTLLTFVFRVPSQKVELGIEGRKDDILSRVEVDFGLCFWFVVPIRKVWEIVVGDWTLMKDFICLEENGSETRGSPSDLDSETSTRGRGREPQMNSLPLPLTLVQITYLHLHRLGQVGRGGQKAESLTSTRLSSLPSVALSESESKGAGAGAGVVERMRDRVTGDG